MNVGIIDHVGRKAGMDYYTSSLAASLSENNINVHVYSNFYHQGSNYNTHDIFPFFIKNPILRFALIFNSFLRSIISIRKHKISTVIVHLFSADLYYVFLLSLLKLSGIKLVLINHDSESFAGSESQALRGFIYNKLSNKIVVHNQHSMESTLPLVGNSEKVTIVKHGAFDHVVDNSIIRRDARKKYDLDENDFFVVFFGQIKKVKRLDVFLDSIDCKKGIKYHVAGRVWKDDFSPYQEIINSKNLTSCLSLNIGYINDDEREILLKAADAIVLPYDEVYQSGVLLMAMSYGLCPIVSDIKAFKEIVSDKKTGILFEKGNPESLAEGIDLLYKDEQLRSKISNSCLKYVKDEYSWEKIANDYIEKIFK